AEVASIVRSPVPPPPVVNAAVTTTIIPAPLPLRSLGRAPSQFIKAFLWIPLLYVRQGQIFQSVLDDPDVCRSVVDQLAPPGLFSQLHRMDYDQLFTEFNVGAARQTCLGAEVRMWLKHNLRERKILEGRCARQVDMLKGRMRKLRPKSSVVFTGTAKAALVSELDNLKERNIALEEKRNTLGQVATLESATATKDVELASLHSQIAKLTQGLSSLQLSCDELSIRVAKDGFADQVSLLETTCFGLRDQVSSSELFKEQYEAIQDEQVKALSDRVVRLDSELMAQSLHLDEEFYPRFLTTIAGRRWIIDHGLRLAVMKCHQSLEYGAGVIIGLTIDKGIQVGLVAGIDHGNAKRGLADVASYDPYVEARYVSTVLAFCDLDFKLLSQLESQKDASIADIMSLLRLEAPSAETPETSLSDSLDVVHARVQKLKEGALSHHLSNSDAMGALDNSLSSKNLIVIAATTTALAISVTAANINSIPPILVANYDMPDAGLSSSMQLSAGIVAFVLYVSENGVSLLLDLIMDYVFSLHQAVSLRMLDKSEALADT
ncbi:hypothetical protein Tco_0982676, partial [Tanacetum coccineum]